MLWGFSMGRYINCPPPGKNPNCYFGYRKHKDGDLGFTVVIRAIPKPNRLTRSTTVAIKKREELYISYGSGYWNSTFLEIKPLNEE
jgi:hypothetical protein